MAIASGVRPKFALAPNFRQFLRNIRPPKKRREGAKKYPTMVRDFLERTDLLTTREPHTKLTGSYGRRIAIHEIKDVDLVAYVDERYEELGPLKALQDLKAALEAFADEFGEEGERPEVELREQRRTVRVHFKADDFFLDVVPVRAPEATDAVRLLVPDREWKNWQPTACVAYRQHFSELNQGSCEEMLAPLLQTIKHWRSKWLKRNQAKSFWLEAMIVNLIELGKITFTEKSLAEVVADTFRAVRDECAPYLERARATPIVPDPMIPAENPNVAWNWDRADFETFVRRVDGACDKVDNAVDVPHELLDAAALRGRYPQFSPSAARSRPGTLRADSSAPIAPSPRSRSWRETAGSSSASTIRCRASASSEPRWSCWPPVLGRARSCRTSHFRRPCRRPSTPSPRTRRRSRPGASPS